MKNVKSVFQPSWTKKHNNHILLRDLSILKNRVKRERKTRPKDFLGTNYNYNYFILYYWKTIARICQIVQILFFCINIFSFLFFNLKSFAIWKIRTRTFCILGFKINLLSYGISGKLLFNIDNDLFVMFGNIYCINKQFRHIL